jgi:PTS system nitrogen regulatory IIA component
MLRGLSAMPRETSVRVSDLLEPKDVAADLRVADKDRALHELARRGAAFADFPEQAFHEALLVREQLGSTGVGAGVAMPHARIAGLSGFHAIFARLAKPIDFAAVDGRSVDLIFLLLAPEGADSLAALASAPRTLRNPAIARRLREATDAAALHAVLTEPSIG